MYKKTEKDMRLSLHYELSELTTPSVASREGVRNVPTRYDIDRMRLLCERVLEPLWKAFGPLRVVSGFRSGALNEALGHAPTSLHQLGMAADIQTVRRHMTQAVAIEMAAWVQQHLEYTENVVCVRRKTGTVWLHVSYDANELTRRTAIVVY